MHGSFFDGHSPAARQCPGICASEPSSFRNDVADTLYHLLRLRGPEVMLESDHAVSHIQ